MNYTRTSTLCGPPGCMKKQTRGPVAYPGNKGFITAKQAAAVRRLKGQLLPEGSLPTVGVAPTCTISHRQLSVPSAKGATFDFMKAAAGTDTETSKKKKSLLEQLDPPEAVVYGSSLLRPYAESVGRLGAIESLTPVVIPRALRSPAYAMPNGVAVPVGTRADSRAKRHKRLFNILRKVEPESLKHTKLRLGGPSLIGDVLRTWKNPRLTLPAKLFGSVVSPVVSAQTMLIRADHYNPFSDTVTLYTDHPAILSHELGHAMDFNSWAPTEPVERVKSEKGLRKLLGVLRRQIKAVPADMYRAARILAATSPISALLNVPVEAAANIRSWDALKRALKDKPDALKAMKQLRTQALPAAYSTYLSNAALPFVRMHTLAPLAYAAAVRSGANAVAPGEYETLISQLDTALKATRTQNSAKDK